MDRKKCIIMNNLFFLFLYILLVYYNSKYISSYNNIIVKIGNSNSRIIVLNYFYITCYFVMPLIVQFYSYFYNQHQKYFKYILIILCTIFFVFAIYSNRQALYSDFIKFISIVICIQGGAVAINKNIYNSRFIS